MRLKKLKLVGFKSFVDPTNVIFPSNLVAVVGPNGCGKSNIIDAVRWVMGESSAKNLRGESMADVIFNGSSQRKPIGQASVEMIFDNSEGKLVGEYASYNEISVKRVVTRDGQSNYYLNGNRCRKKDISDIFLGTGLGPRSYSIIGQGTISRLIEAKPEELRIYLEEAAGISKYKERRRETESRIAHTRENLDRINDLCSEMALQIEKLQRQAAAAEKYKDFKQQERLLRAQGYALRWQELHQQLELQQQRITQHNLHKEAELANLRNVDSEIEQLRIQHHTTTESFNQSQTAYYGIGAEIARLEEAVQHQQQRRQQLDADLAQSQSELTVAQDHLATDNLEIEELIIEIDKIEPLFTDTLRQLEVTNSQLAAVEQARHMWQQDWDNFNYTAAESSKQAHVAQTKIQHLEQNINAQLLRIEKLQQEQASLDKQPLLSKIEELQQQQQLVTEQQTSLSQSLQQHTLAISEQREQNNCLSQQVDAIKLELQHNQGQITSLEALQHVALGKNNEAVVGWLQQHQLTDYPRLAQELVVEEGWEKAVETVLCDYLQAVCLENFDSLNEIVSSFSKGNITLLDLSFKQQHHVTATKPKLPQKVTTKIAQINGLLANIYAADDLSQAQAWLAEIGDHESIVTRDGLWLAKGWLRIAKDSDPKSGVLQRSQQLKTMQTKLLEQQDQLIAAKESYEQGLQKLHYHEQERDQISQQLTSIHQEVADCNARLRVTQASLSQIELRSSAITDELAEQQQDIEEAQQQLYVTRNEWQQAMNAMEHDADKREHLVSSRESLNNQLEQLRLQQRQQRENHQELTVRMNTAQSKLSSCKQNILRVQERIESLTSRYQALIAARDQAYQPDADTTELLQQKLAAHSHAEDVLKQARMQVESITAILRENESNRLNIEEKIRGIQAKLDQLRLDGQTLTVKCSTIEEAIAETDFTLDQLIEELPSEADAKSWENQLQVVVNKIQQLGAVNLAAIDEYQIESQRKQYLDSQHLDLTQALETLEDAIAKIDRETRQRFKQTYDQVNKSFQQLFPRLFGGGQAYLELTGEDLLDTGVTVMARPPGKRNSNIYLLSGGEKAMTAVALVFAIFQLNPSPFCMLDEVDAPLDDSNVSRFCAMVKEMSTQIQFIFVTHNKVAMELASHLSGVTMHEPGVSRIVSVDIDEAVSLAEA